MKQILLTSLLALLPLGAVLGQAAAPPVTEAPQPKPRRVVTPPAHPEVNTTQGTTDSPTPNNTARGATTRPAPPTEATARGTTSRPRPPVANSRASRVVRPSTPPTRSTSRTSRTSRSGTGSVQRVPSRPTASAGVNRTAGRANSFVSSGDLNSNITINLTGSLLGLFDVDFDLTSCGPMTRAEFVIPSAQDDIPASIATVQYTMSESRGSYRIDYSVGARVPQVTAVVNNGKARNIEFRNVTLNGAVRLGDGESVVLSKVNGKTLNLSVAPKGKKNARVRKGRGAAGAAIGAAVGGLDAEAGGEAPAPQPAPPAVEAPAVEAP